MRLMKELKNWGDDHYKLEKFSLNLNIRRYKTVNEQKNVNSTVIKRGLKGERMKKELVVKQFEVIKVVQRAKDFRKYPRLSVFREYPQWLL